MTRFDDIVNAVVKICQVLMPLLLVAVPILLSRQTRDLKAHSDENAKSIKEAVTAATGTHKTL